MKKFTFIVTSLLLLGGLWYISDPTQLIKEMFQPSQSKEIQQVKQAPSIIQIKSKLNENREKENPLSKKINRVDSIKIISKRSVLNHPKDLIFLPKELMTKEEREFDEIRNDLIDSYEKELAQKMIDEWGLSELELNKYLHLKEERLKNQIIIRKKIAKYLKSEIANPTEDAIKIKSDLRQINKSINDFRVNFENKLMESLGKKNYKKYFEFRKNKNHIYNEKYTREFKGYVVEF